MKIDQGFEFDCKNVNRAIFGKVELKNGVIIKWMRFAADEDEAMRLVTAEHAYHVTRCWIED